MQSIVEIRLINFFPFIYKFQDHIDDAFMEVERTQVETRECQGESIRWVLLYANYVSLIIYFPHSCGFDRFSC